ncbi:hypothetical protein [Cerasicoccus maritimus]|uniref:hypothetical protein n=1 Tax=Cerasicoccus maritimus TaxID=490089 RepID=UPI0028525AAF|nr:hypothetical protein [Cerasicoccus maritimus]
MAGLANAADLFRGMTEDEVIAVLGNPNSSMGRSNKLILMYGDAEVELRAGRLYTARGRDMDYLAPDGQSQFAYASGRGWTLNGQPVPLSYRYTVANQTVEQAIEPTVEAPPEPEPETVEPVAEPTVEPEMDYDEYDDYEYDEFDEFYDEELYADYEPTTMELTIAVALRFLIEFIITLIVVKISFEQKGFPVLMPQLFMLSLAQGFISFLLDCGFIALNFHNWMIEQGIEFVTLSTLIYLITDVTQSITAMTIAAIARPLTFFAYWVAVLGLAYAGINLGGFY